MNSRKGANNHDVKRQNKLLILKMIATGSGFSRVEIARKTGLTKMTVGNLISELIEENLISEKGYDIEIVKVKTFADAINYLENLE